jgi:sulfate adenylyltransferase
MGFPSLNMKDMPAIAESQPLISPHGGALVNLLVGAERADDLRAGSQRWPSWQLTPRQLCDLELLLTGAYSPLKGFMGRGDYESVCSSMRLRDGTLWPVPITLDVPAELAARVQPGSMVALRDLEGVMLAVLCVQDAWLADREHEAKSVYGTSDPRHPGVAAILSSRARWILGGPIEGLQLPAHYDFRRIRLGPSELRAEFSRLGIRHVVAFQPNGSLHRPYRQLTSRIADSLDAHLLVHPAAASNAPDDREHYTKVRQCQQALSAYPPGSATLALLPFATRSAGPREAVLHAIVRKNHGCTHMFVRRDHSDPGEVTRGRPFYDPGAARDLFDAHQAELGVSAVSFGEMLHLPDEDRCVRLPPDGSTTRDTMLSIGGSAPRRRSPENDLSVDMSAVDAAERRVGRAGSPQGITVFFTGLSGAGKSTVANVLLIKLLEMGDRVVTLLDGDIVRKHLSSELGFSREHRDINIRRIGFVASEITKNGGIAICAPIAPYDSVRKEVREMVAAVGTFVLVHVATPLDVCEQRDRKGLYAKARAGLIEQFTGVSDPYEIPEDAEIVLETTDMAPEESAERVIRYLVSEGYLIDDAGTEPKDEEEVGMGA